jgi:prevent-host-death family protein
MKFGKREISTQTVRYGAANLRRIDVANHRGAGDARDHFPELLESAERGISTVITKRGRAVAVLAPADAVQSIERQPTLLTLAGSGRGLWVDDSAAAVAALRDEWDR